MPGYLGFGNVLTSTAAGVLGAQPVPFEFTVPVGTWKFIFAQTLYTSDATAGSRAPSLEIIDDTGVSQCLIGLGGQVPSATVRYLWQVGTDQTVALAVFAQHAMPSNLMLLGGWVMRFNSPIAGAGDSQVIAFQLGSAR